MREIIVLGEGIYIAHNILKGSRQLEKKKGEEEENAARSKYNNNKTTEKTTTTKSLCPPTFWSKTSLLVEESDK